MKITIEKDKPKTFTFKDVRPGQRFVYKKSQFIKVNTDSSDVTEANGVNLGNGDACLFEHCDKVRLLGAKTNSVFTTIFNKIKPGEAFIFENKVYIKFLGNNVNAFCVSNGHPDYISVSTQVLKTKSSLNVKVISSR